MKRIARILSVIALALLALGASAGTVYKSKAADGSIVYSDHPPADGKIDQTITYEDLPSSPLPPSPPSRRERPPVSTAPAEKHQDVTLYAASWCGYCKRAKAWLARKHIDFQEIDVESEVGRAEFQVAAHGGGIPYLVSGHRHVRGFKPEGYEMFFASR